MNGVNGLDVGDPMLEPLRASLEGLIAEVCHKYAETPPPTRLWKEMTHRDRSGFGIRTSTKVDNRFHPVFNALHTLTSIDPVIEAIQGNPALVEWLLRTTEGNIVDPSWRRQVIEATLVSQALFVYLARAGRFVFDNAVLKVLFADIVRDFRSTVETAVTVSPLYHIFLDATRLDLGDGIVLRSLDDHEFERWLNTDEPMGGELMPDQHALDLGAVLEVTLQIPRQDDANANIIPEPRTDVVTALRLVLRHPVQIAFTEVLPGALPSFTRSPFLTTQRLPYIQHGTGKVPFSASHGDDLLSLWRQLQTSPYKVVVALAIRRWDDAMERRRNDDQLLDYWIALESLISGGAEGEAAVKYALRIATWLGGDAPSRVVTFRNVRKSYSWRSKISHGDKAGQERLEGTTPLAEITMQTQGYLKDVILKVLTHGKPSDQNLDDLVDQMFDA